MVDKLPCFLKENRMDTGFAKNQDCCRELAEGAAEVLWEKRAE